MGSSSVPDESEQYVDDARFRIPFDLFVSKKQKNGILGSGSCIRFNDSCGNLVFKVERPPPPNSRDQKSAATFHQNPPIKLIFNASGNTLFCIRKLTVRFFSFLLFPFCWKSQRTLTTSSFNIVQKVGIFIFFKVS